MRYVDTSATCAPMGLRRPIAGQISNPTFVFRSSSLVSQSPPALRELMSALVDVLRQEQVRWYLFGAQAATVWGEPRMSADVDITVDLGDRSYRELVEAMRAGGFDLRVSAIDTFVRDTRILPFLHRESGIPLDMVLAGSGLEALLSAPGDQPSTMAKDIAI